MSETDKIRIDLEREKWRDELRFREREIAIKEKEQQGHEGELRLKTREQERSRWTNPLVIAVLAASVAASGNAIVAWLNAYEQQRADSTKAEQARDLDEKKSEADRILEVIKTNNDPDKAATNLKFLVDAGLILNPRTKEPLETYLKNRRQGEGATLPSPAASGTTLTDGSLGDWVAVGFLGSPNAADQNFTLPDEKPITALSTGTIIKAKSSVNVRPAPANWNLISSVLNTGQCFTVKETRALRAGTRDQVWARGDIRAARKGKLPLFWPMLVLQLQCEEGHT